MNSGKPENAEPFELKLILAGVGGQGVVFATRLLARTAVAMGHRVLASETHGMSRRGGSVLAHVKIGGTDSPLIHRGTADVLLALDRDEGYKSVEFLRPGGSAFINTPDGFDPAMEQALERLRSELHCLPATSLAMSLGSPTVSNVVLLGYAASHPAFPIPLERLREVLSELTPGRAELNLRALRAGQDAVAA